MYQFTCGLGGLTPGGIYASLPNTTKPSPSSSRVPGLPEPGVFFPGEGAKSPTGPYGITAQMRTFEVPSADGRRPPKFSHDSEPAKLASHGTVPPNWSDTISSSKGLSGFFPGRWAYDKPAPDAPIECRSPPSNHTPSGLTPSESHNTSSQTSFSPHPEEARKGSTGPSNDQQPGASPAFFSFPNSRGGVYMGNQASTPSQDGSSNASYNIQQKQTSNSEAFQLPPGGWSFGSGNTPMVSGMSPPPMPTGTTPLPSGMSTPANGDWSQILGHMAWNNSTGPEQGSIDWKQNQRDEPKYGYKSGFFVSSDEPGLHGLSIPK